MAPSTTSDLVSNGTATSSKAHCSIAPVSERDRLAGTISYDTIQGAVEAFHRDGFCAISNAIAPEIVDQLNAKMLAETSKYLQRPTLHFNQGRKACNISQTPPLTKEYMFKEIWVNPHALTVLKCIIGPEPELRFVNSNVSFPNPNPSACQAVHSDAYHDHLNFTWAVMLNIYLCDVSPAND